MKRLIDQSFHKYYRTIVWQFLATIVRNEDKIHSTPKPIGGMLNKMIIKIQISLLILLIFQSYACSADEIQKLSEDQCKRTGTDVEIQHNVLEAGTGSDILLQLLSGNTEKATEALSFH